ncbi:MAG: hypothetical protein ACXW15_10195 [Acidimicrobiia bacterium]
MLLMIVAIVAAVAATVTLGIAIRILIDRLTARRRTSSVRRNLCFWCGAEYRKEPADHEAEPDEWLHCRACGQKIHDRCQHQIRALQADWVVAHPEAILTCPACGRRSINDESAALMAKLTKELNKYAKKADARPPGAEH